MRHPRASWIALMAIVAIAHSAGAASVDWSEAFALQSRGAGLDPAVLVGFDPQPEPPVTGRAALDLTDRTAPLLILRDQSNPPGGLQLFDFFLAVDVGQTIAIVPCILPSDLEPRLELEVRADTATGPILFAVFADFSTSSGGLVDPASVVGFDPQPDPPGEFGASFGLTLAFDRLSDVQVRFAMAPAGGAPLAFTQVPEPSAVALLGLGVAMCAASRRRSTRR
jgi:hypothetical protein